MDVVLAVFYLGLCCALILRMRSRGKLTDFQLGVIATFSLGYYVLPVIFKPFSSLKDVPASDIATALCIHGLYFLGVILGVELGPRIVKSHGLSSGRLDEAFARYHRPIFFVSAGVYIAYLVLVPTTSYSAMSFQAFLQDRSPLLAALSAVANIFLGATAMSFALELRKNMRALSKAPVLVAMLLTFFSIFILSLVSAQRLLIITPLVAVFCALLMTKQKSRAVGSLGLMVIVLLVVSPFAVFLRESQVGLRGQARLVSVGRNFTFGENALGTSLQSILDRADLIQNTIALKRYIDVEGFVGWTYYYSVLISPVPKALIGPKPYLLSDDGTMNGEISIIAWRLVLHNFDIGSLTAFGGISAYREGGWVVVPIDGVLTGLLFIFLGQWLGQGGLIARVFYVVLFPVLSVKRVPPSLFEALAEILPLLPFVVPFALVGLLRKNSFSWIRTSRHLGRPTSRSGLHGGR